MRGMRRADVNNLEGTVLDINGSAHRYLRRAGRKASPGLGPGLPQPLGAAARRESLRRTVCYITERCGPDDAAQADILRGGPASPSRRPAAAFHPAGTHFPPAAAGNHTENWPSTHSGFPSRRPIRKVTR